MTQPGHSGLRWSSWNLLLLLPLGLLITPIFNRTGPALFGLPFYYWFQLAGVAVGVLATSVVFAKTKDKPTAPPPGPDRDVDTLDEGAGA
ncbi:DUF3311 domain-containing protein [Actinokineospora globicatena]|uniref:Uncharacterized protein n=1 Tax=Actinokineospora globicatena TaxID=103729 RepID=A0A9W6VAK6_9PSEU|nr:DUF3311 domain-containing protein [Actinokineospora globicatena]MCP2301332.1 Protein of unknown function (DUF3311) [Actinokineospora globicatena]GLW77029.1 hypothetical protein Aglo01_15110 [Actinokineospora globicatena]GLW83863.1 hypothetical protein Aglo02_15030 [Actinokineospora globicatena]GLW92196.1 hypothetical protein Aglo03_30120 [Actinokineospora globicatena]